MAAAKKKYKSYYKPKKKAVPFPPAITPELMAQLRNDIIKELKDHEEQQRIKVELEWNDAFVTYLKSQGIEGTDEDQTVQKWVALLLMQINDRMENPEDRSSALE